MNVGIALVSRVLTGEEPCLRKVQLSKQFKLPVDAQLIKHTINHENLVSKVLNKYGTEALVNTWVRKELTSITVVGKIDIVLLLDTPVIIEVKSGKEKNSHHVQLWMYMDCYGTEVHGILRYSGARYLYETDDIPVDLWKTVEYRLNPLLCSDLLPPIRNGHCEYCGYKMICNKLYRGDTRV
jgi:CRISPR/Cas system-associated exonuclease Cas4 (RecB family)